MTTEQFVIAALLLFLGYREYQQMGMVKALLNRVMAKSYSEVAAFEAGENRPQAPENPNFIPM